MYPNSPTYTEELIQLIEQGRLANEITDGQVIKDLIESHDTSDMRTGVAYYLNENDILQKQQTYYKNGQRVADTQGLKPNNRIPHNWHRVLVDQKTSYIVGKPVTFDTDDEAFLEKINDLTGEDFDDTMNEIIKHASNKGVEWLHPYIDEEGDFDYVIFPAEQIIPIYDGSKQKNLIAALRYYPITVKNKDGKEKEINKVEIYTENEIFYFIQQDNGEYVEDVEEESPASYFQYIKDGETNNYGWGKVPLIPFRNNEEEKNDLTFYKQLIDAYDKLVSNNANSFDELQQIIYVLKGYEGQDLTQFVENVLFYGAINVEEDGGVDTLTPTIEMDASEKHLDRLKQSIFLFGQGVDAASKQIGESGNAVSGVALKFLYSLLDLKANHTERKARKALQTLMWFFTEFLSIKGEGDYNPEDVSYTFNRTMITNEAEKAEMAKNSMGVISTETIVENHPWAAEDEMDRLEKQKDEYSRNLPPVGEEE
jgi:SPP1 family phage portal protein